jgi:hypothetical protein
MQLDPLQTPPRSINLATPDFLVMNGTVRGGRSTGPSSYLVTIPPAFLCLHSCASIGVSKMLAVGGFRWHLLEQKKDPKVLFSMTDRRQWKSVDHKLERENGLEPSTSTLARLRSTN